MSKSRPCSRRMLLHDLRVVPPHAAQVILIHGVARRAPVGQDLVPVQAAADELPVVALRVHAELVALDDFDVVGRDQPARAEAELVLAKPCIVDLGRRALEQAARAGCAS